MISRNKKQTCFAFHARRELRSFTYSGRRSEGRRGYMQLYISVVFDHWLKIDDLFDLIRRNLITAIACLEAHVALIRSFLEVVAEV